MNKSIWIKIKSPDAKVYTMYTKDPEIAEQYRLFPKRQGKYFFRNRKFKKLKWLIFGNTPEQDRWKYSRVRMIRSSDIFKSLDQHHIRLDEPTIRAIEKEQNWNKEDRSWDRYDEFLEEKRKKEWKEWAEKCVKRGYDPVSRKFFKR